MKFLDVNQHLSELDEHIRVLKSYGDVFEAVEARITRVINMDGTFKGEGAKGVIYNHAYMQLPTIRSIRAFLISFSETLEKMKANINEYEPASNGSVSEDFWKNQIPKAYDRYEETLEEREAAINQATAEVSHILHLGKLQTGDVYNSVDSARKHADTVLEGLYDLDQAGVELMAQVRTKMEELKATIRQVLDWTMTGGVTMKGVSIMEVGGYFANNATLHEKAPEVDTSKMSANVHDPSLSNLSNYVKMSQAVAKLKQGLQVWGRLFQASVFHVFHHTYVEKLVSRALFSTSQSPKVQTQVQRDQELDAIIEERKVVLTLEEEEALKQYLSDPTNFEGKTLIRPADTERPAPHFDSYSKVLGNPNSDVNMLASGHITTATGNFFAEDFITLVDSEASMGEKALAAGFILVKPAKLVDKLLDLNKARKINNSSGSSGSQSSNPSSGSQSADKRSTDVNNGQSTANTNIRESSGGANTQRTDGPRVSNVDEGKSVNGKDIVTSNKGNKYDITPMPNHSTTTSVPNPNKGISSGSVDILDKKTGQIKTRRYHDIEGRALRDVDFTNHGNPKLHPEWPHEHIFEWDKLGKFRRK